MEPDAAGGSEGIGAKSNGVPEGQRGYPPSIRTDAKLGRWVMAYPSAGILFEPAMATAPSWLALKALGRTPIPARRLGWPDARPFRYGPRWETVRVVQQKRTSRHRLGTKWVCSLMTWPMGRSCGANVDRLQLVFTPSRWVIFHNVGDAQRNPLVCPPPHSLGIHRKLRVPTDAKIVAI